MSISIFAFPGKTSHDSVFLFHINPQVVVFRRIKAIARRMSFIYQIHIDIDRNMNGKVARHHAEGIEPENLKISISVRSCQTAHTHVHAHV